MADAFLSTKKGTISDLNLYSYRFSDWILANAEKRNNLINWLHKKSDFIIYEIDKTSFTTYTAIKAVNNSQFHFVEQKGLKPPFLNTQLVSSYISSLLKKELGKHYSQFLNTNVFVLEKNDLYPFQLLKAVEFYVEVFSTGTYLIHTLPVTKIISIKDPIDSEYISYLRSTNKNNAKTDEMEFSIVRKRKFYRKKYDLLDSGLLEKIKSDFSDNAEFIATFDYHFLVNYSPDIFGKITQNAKKTLKQVLISLNQLLEKIKLPDSFALDSQNYYKVPIIELEHKNNLLVGLQDMETITIHGHMSTKYGLRVEFTREDIAKEELITNFIKDEKLAKEVRQMKPPCQTLAKVEYRETWKQPYLKKLITGPDITAHFECNKQNASYHNGIYKPVSNSAILPIITGRYNIESFCALLQKFNRGGKEFFILPAINVDSDENLDISLIQQKTASTTSKLLIAIFCGYHLPNDFFEPLRQAKLRYQIYQGQINNSDQDWAKLSNFVCKCLEKLGGVIAVIKDTYIKKDGYFMGIDLGHTTVGGDRYSNLAMTLFDSKGVHVADSIIKNISLQENLDKESCETALRELSKKLKKLKLNQPTQLVVHRDGKLHSVDIDVLTTSITMTWGTIEVDIVEIIKSGFPVIAQKNEHKEAVTPMSGISYQDNFHKYAILVTNSQVDEENGVLNPLIIKHKYGKTEYNKIVDQVYWFTKMYTNNLYNSTRLPATTLKANNIVSTSSKIHRTTYLG